MAAKTGNDDSWQPMTGAEDARIRKLGSLLRLRRAALGYPHVPQFIRDRKINTRMVGDLEHGRRDTYTFPSLENAARAYDVTYDSMLDVVWSDAGELVPAPSADPAPFAAPGLPHPPQSELLREDTVRPYATPIWERLLELAGRGVLDPDGAQLGLDPRDAKVWDGSAGAMTLADRAWLVGDIQRRRREGRRASPEADATSA